jgi:hypothetical protein
MELSKLYVDRVRGLYRNAANHSESFIRCSYVICAFTYRIVELVFVLSNIRSSV